MKLENIIREFSIDEIIFFEEKYDRQYLALKTLYESIKYEELFIKLVILNAINSFKLKMKGEEYWETFSNYFSTKKNIEYFPEFLEKYNNIFLKIKLERFKKVKDWLENVNVFDFTNLEYFVTEISKILSQRKYDKTIVFSAKMLNYAFRIIGRKTSSIEKIFIPIDFRIGKISRNINFWKRIYEKTKIPLIFIDSLIWVTYNMDVNKIEEESLREKVKKLKNFLNNNIL